VTAIRKVFALGPGQTCKVGYFRIFGKPQQTATFSLFHGRLPTVLASGIGGQAAIEVSKQVNTNPFGETGTQGSRMRSLR